MTVGATIDAAVGYFLLMERCAEVQVKASVAQPISEQVARRVHDRFDEQAAWQVFQWAQRTHVPD